MEKIKSPIGRLLVHVALILFSIYSIVPFYWTALQSFKNLKDANSRTPKFFFTPTWENYQELWLRSLPENAVVVVVSNDEILATRAWKRLMAVAKPNAYILEGGLNLWLNIYGVPEEETDRHGKAGMGKPDGTLRHSFKLALGDRHAAAQPDEHLVPHREYTARVKLLKKLARAGGCD